MAKDEDEWDLIRPETPKPPPAANEKLPVIVVGERFKTSEEAEAYEALYFNSKTLGFGERWNILIPFYESADAEWPERPWHDADTKAAFYESLKWYGLTLDEWLMLHRRNVKKGNEP